MDEQTSAGGSSGAEAELPIKWALERAELQSDVDTLVHQVLAGLLTAADDLKRRIRDEMIAEVQHGRRERDAVLREIDAARQELERVHARTRGAGAANIERVREAIIAEARAEAERIVEAARTSLLEEIRASQNQLRELQQQVQSLMPGEGVTSSARPDQGGGTEPPARAEAYLSPPAASATVSIPDPRPTPVAPTVIHTTPAAATTFSRPIDSGEEPTVPRTMQLIFTNVPGYQRAAAIERATRRLPEVSNVDVQEFERGRLVLEAQVGDPSAVADAMIAGAPAEMFVVEHSASAITFQLS
jgi:hypothetical protein